MLIELVKGKPELYDLTSLHYSDNVAKRKGWVEITRQLNLMLTVEMHFLSSLNNFPIQ